MSTWRMLCPLLVPALLVMSAPSAAAAGSATNGDRFVELASTKFGKLTEAEKKLFRAVADGEIADLSGDAGMLRADRIAWLFRNPQALSLITGRGVAIKGARIEGELDLKDADVPFPLECANCAFGDKITLTNAKIRRLDLTGTHTAAIDASHLKVEGSVYLDQGFRATDTVTLEGANVGGYLTCTGGHFLDSGKVAIRAVGLTVGADAYFNAGFIAEGEVNLINARIGSNLDLQGGKFLNKEGYAIRASGIRVGATTFMSNGFMADGAVDIVGGYIGGNFQCDGAHFINPRDYTPANSSELYALAADSLVVKGNVFLRRGFKVKGGVRFERTGIEGVFEWTGLDRESDVMLDLRLARIGSLVDDKASWPPTGKLHLNGLVYQDLYQEGSAHERDRIEWLLRQPDFAPQPYDQLASVMKKAGKEDDAVEILIAKEWERPTTLSNILWKFPFGPMIGYGHRPLHALAIGFFIVALGFRVFRWAGREGLLEPTKENLPTFNAFVYSLDVFLPVINLHQESYWLPNSSKTEPVNVNLGRWGFRVRRPGSWVQFYFWFQIIAGWTLTTLFIAGLTGLVKS
jgi:hypothetical protein